MDWKLTEDDNIRYDTSTHRQTNRFHFSVPCPTPRSSRPSTSTSPVTRASRLFRMPSRLPMLRACSPPSKPTSFVPFSLSRISFLPFFSSRPRSCVMWMAARPITTDASRERRGFCDVPPLSRRKTTCPSPRAFWLSRDATTFLSAFLSPLCLFFVVFS